MLKLTPWILKLVNYYTYYIYEKVIKELVKKWQI